MAKDSGMEEQHAAEEHDEGSHELPRGALLITITYLVIMTVLWLQVYLQLLNNGGIPRQ